MVQGLEFRLKGFLLKRFMCRATCSGFRVWFFRLRVYNLGSMYQGLGFRVQV
jgi:hypothetical protein